MSATASSPAKDAAPVPAQRTLRAELLSLAGNLPYTASLLLTILLAYGFSIAHNSISTDDFTSEIYYPLNGEMVAQGRFTIVILANLFRMLKNVPYFCDVLSVVCLGLAAMLMCVFFDRAMGGRLSGGAKIVFSCVLVSFPVINEIFVYGGGNLNACLGYTITAAALLQFQQWYAEKKKRSLPAVFILLFFVVSLYESFAVVFVCGVIMILILNFYYNPADADKGRFGKVLCKGLVAIGVLAAAVVVELIAGKIVLKALGMEASVNAANGIWWLDLDFPLRALFRSETRQVAWEALITHWKELIVMMISDATLYYYVAAPHYLPLLLMDVFTGLAVLLGVAAWIKHKNFTIAALFFALTFMQCFLWLLSGKVSPLRTCQHYAVFVAFLTMLLYERLTGWAKTTARLKRPAPRKAISIVAGLLAFWLIFMQTYDLNNWLFLDVLRSEEEIAVARDIGNELQTNYDTKNKPVVFIGKYEISSFITDQCTLPKSDPRKTRAAAFFYKLGLYQVYKNVNDYYDSDSLKFVRSNLNSYLYWATSAFEQPNGEMMKLYRYLGYDFHSVDAYEAYKLYVPMNLIMPAYPNEGYITEEDGVIVVNLGALTDLGGMGA